MTNKEIRNRQWFVGNWTDSSKFVSPGSPSAYIKKDSDQIFYIRILIYTIDECLRSCRLGQWHEVQPETVLRYIRKQRQLARQNESISRT